MLQKYDMMMQLTAYSAVRVTNSRVVVSCRIWVLDQLIGELSRLLHYTMKQWSVMIMFQAA